MIRRFAFVFLLTVSFITMAISYGDYEEQMRNYYDSLYQRSYVKKQQSRDESSEIVKLEMPGVHPETNDTYLCTAVDLQNRKAYIAGFQPHAEMHTAHHMLLFGCPMPAENSLSSDGKFWYDLPKGK